jgi:CRP-like cAMP-binding protein
MMATTQTPVVTRNQLLAALPPEVLSRLSSRLHPVAMTIRQVLFVPDVSFESVYFVESGWISLVTSLDDGSQAEVGLVGREGMAGLSLLLGIDTPYVEAMVQGDGDALRMEAGAFRRALDEEPEFQALLFRYCEAMFAQVTQTAACNGRHGLEQRLARWLLMTHDRAEGDDLHMTHEFLGLMLCVYRPSITVIANTLQRAGIIRAGRGHITILDRDALEDTACDCYRAVKRRFARVLGH